LKKAHPGAVAMVFIPSAVPDAKAAADEVSVPVNIRYGGKALPTNSSSARKTGLCIGYRKITPEVFYPRLPLKLSALTEAYFTLEKVLWFAAGYEHTVTVPGRN